MSCSANSCVENCTALVCQSSGTTQRTTQRSTPLTSNEPLSLAEDILLQEYAASVSQRPVAKLSSLPAAFVCELARSSS